MDGFFWVQVATMVRGFTGLLVSLGLDVSFQMGVGERERDRERERDFDSIMP